MNFFSDREKGKKSATENEISVPVWNGIVAVFDNFNSNNSFAKNFPELCSDKKGIIGCNLDNLYDKLHALVPDMPIPVARIEKKDVMSWEKKIEKEIDTFSILDFIEFCHDNLSQANNLDFHEYFGHYHLEFQDSEELRKKFRDEINTLFERNGIAYMIQDNGQVIRLVDPELADIINFRYKSKDDKLDSLLIESTSAYLLPKSADRYRAMEKLWDAFERLKTYLGTDKKKSSEELLKIASNGNAELEAYLNKEAKELTEIGNKFQIRHFEQGKVEINDQNHLDYLFHRLLSFINLVFKNLP